MKKSEVLNAWASILTGQKPTLSIEITRECPLRCPGCYAYEPEHLGPGGVNLRQLSDYKGDDLVRRILATDDDVTRWERAFVRLDSAEKRPWFFPGSFVAIGRRS